MIVLPKWLKEVAEQQRQMRRDQPRVTSEQARKQVERVERESAQRDALDASHLMPHWTPREFPKESNSGTQGESVTR